MERSKKIAKVLELNGPLLVVEFAVERLIDSVHEYVQLVNSLPSLKENEHDAWGELETQAEARIELDVHSTVSTCEILFKLAKGVPELREAIDPDLVEHIHLLRSHYEHWDQMKHHYRTPLTPGAIPDSRGSKNVIAYRRRFGASPKGGLKVEYDKTASARSISWVRVGGSLEPYELQLAIRKIRYARDRILAAG